MDNPPVNALTVAGWFELADTITDLGREPRRAGRGAAGRGARLQRRRRHQGDAGAPTGFDALIGANRGCYAAFAAVYECAVPGDRRRQRLLPRRRHRPGRQRRRHRRRRRRHLRPPRGRPGRARRRHPPVPPRAPAQDAGDGLHVGHGHGPGAAPLRHRPRGRARRPSCATPRFRVAEAIAAKSPTVIRAAKESLNGIDLWDVKRSYRFEQGFTFELNLSGVADEHRDAFVAKRDTDTTT